MNKVNAIPSASINDFLQACLKIHDKYYVLALLGLSSGLRISDMLNMQVGLVLMSPIRLVESKTNKQRTFNLDVKVLNVLSKYIASHCLTSTDYLIYSSARCKSKPLSRSQAFVSIKAAADSIGLNNIGCHSLRKTYARLMYNQKHNLDNIKQALNHDNITTTLLYLIDDFNKIKL